MYFVFVFKQKTAYEVRISDWSSDVCSSDLQVVVPDLERVDPGLLAVARLQPGDQPAAVVAELAQLVERGGVALGDEAAVPRHEIGRASCRERVCQYV